MARFGLIGPSYRSQSLNADCQMTMGWYVEQIESTYGKSALALYPTPGQKLFATIPASTSVRGQLEINGREFAVGGTNFCEVLANGTVNVIAQVANDLLPVSMVASPQQLLLASGGNLYVYWLQTTIGGSNPQPAGTFQQIANSNFSLPSGANGNPGAVEFMTGFFIVLLRNSQVLYISTPFDASTWPALQKIIVSVFPDNVNSITENQNRLWVQGKKRSAVYYASGGPNILDVDPSGNIENGAASAFGTIRADNSIFWIDQDERGSGIVRRASGYTPQRVSNHAIEFALQGYPTISDCVTYSYQDQGHTFVVFTFPTAQHTWVYDVATNMWHERGYWNVGAGNFTAHKSQNHALAFGMHLVGDPGSGNIYQQSISLYTDAGGNPIRRVRRSPHISIENKFMFHNELIIDAETGLGPEPPLLDGNGNPRGPEMMLSWSDDYCHTFSNEYMLDAGQAGQYKKRLRRSRLGRARDRVYQISTTDPVPWRIIEAYLDADPGFKPQERLAHTYGKVT